jgi:hypothetical protein
MKNSHKISTSTLVKHTKVLSEIKESTVKGQLEKNGYVVIPNVLSPVEIKTARGYFDEWLDQNKQLRDLHKIIDSHGIFKFGQVGHQKHAWYIRTREKVQQPFREIWDTDDLVVSFDGTCYIDQNAKNKDSNWTHSDQSPKKLGLTCVQGFVSLTDNEERTFRVYRGTHKIHSEVLGDTEMKGVWARVSDEWVNSNKELKVTIKVPAGAMVLWDSRCFHQNQYGVVLPGKTAEERIVQYVCYLPKNNPGNTKKMQEKRRLYFETRRTTSHWPYPIHVSGLQPQTYGDSARLIDYSLIQKADLSEFQSEIDKLI